MARLAKMTESSQKKQAGYAYLIELFHLQVIPNWHTSIIGQSGSIRSIIEFGQVETTYPQSYWPGDSLGGHLEFALKHDGVNLGILVALFEVISEVEITNWIAAKPMGKSSRRIWFLFEYLTGRPLALPNLKQGNYIDLLDTDQYYTVVPGQNIQRQRVINNLPGGRSFCPIIRRTDKLAAMEKNDFSQRCTQLLMNYPPDLLGRALSYLYSKETKSSFQIEQIKPSTTRTEKFIGLLTMAAYRDFCEKFSLIDLQNRIVDPRFSEADYRQNQNYVGQTISYQRELIRYIPPKPEDLPDLMGGLMKTHQIMEESAIPAIVHAAVIAYGFVFMRPFADGNGRIHRFLIHNILSIRKLIPEGLMFPVSAAMLKNPGLYDHSLAPFSKPLLQLIEYNLDDLGQMTVIGETGRFYRYIDMTAQAEALYDFVVLTVEKELLKELGFLSRYDQARKAIQTVLDMPDPLVDLFIKVCLQNNGHLSARKREAHFSFLTDEEVAAMEKAFAIGYKEIDLKQEDMVDS